MKYPVLIVLGKCSMDSEQVFFYFFYFKFDPTCLTFSCITVIRPGNNPEFSAFSDQKKNSKKNHEAGQHPTTGC